MRINTPGPTQNRPDHNNWLMELLGNRAFVTGVLFLASIFGQILILIAMPLAYILRRQAEEEWEITHYTYLIRTFWITMGALALILIFLVATVLVIDLRFSPYNMDPMLFDILNWVALLIFPLIGYYGIRCILSLTRSVVRKPMPNPRKSLF